MKLVICLMGYQCSGIYEMEEYLIDRYGVKPFKGYTTRKKYRHEKSNSYHFVSIGEMIELGEAKDIISLRVFNNSMYLKKISDIPDGISVCVIDYNGYLELKKDVNTLPVFLKRDLRHRFRDCKKVSMRNQDDFLARDHFDEIQFSLAESDENVIHIPYTGLVSTYIAIDGLMENYHDELNMYNPYTPKVNLFDLEQD